jgi:hypothetical protein
VVADPDLAGRRHVVLESFRSAHRPMVRPIGGARFAALATTRSEKPWKPFPFPGHAVRSRYNPSAFRPPTAAGFL